MKLSRIICLTIVLSSGVCFIGCTKTVRISKSESYWWIGAKTQVKPKGNVRWIEVVKVESDSVYGYYVNPKTYILVSVPLDSVERIEKVESNDFASLLSGILIGGVLGGALFFILLSL